MKTYELVTLFRVHATSCDGEGRDCGLVGYYTKERSAEHAASISKSAPYTSIREVPGLCVRLGPGEGLAYFHLKEAEEIQVNVPVEHVEAEQTRKKALSKLTTAEKIALGLE